MCFCPTFLPQRSKAPRRLTRDSRRGRWRTGKFQPSGRDGEGPPHALILVDLPVGPVDLVAREEVGTRGIDDEPEEESVPWVDVMIDARIRTADSAQVRPGVMVLGVLVNREIPDRLVILISVVVRLSEREGRFADFKIVARSPSNKRNS